MKPTSIALLSLIALVILVGCGTSATVVGTKPGDNLNPAMTPLMRQAKMGGGHHAKTAQ